VKTLTGAGGTTVGSRPAEAGHSRLLRRGTCVRLCRGEPVLDPGRLAATATVDGTARDIAPRFGAAAVLPGLTATVLQPAADLLALALIRWGSSVLHSRHTRAASQRPINKKWPGPQALRTAKR